MPPQPPRPHSKFPRKQEPRVREQFTKDITARLYSSPPPPEDDPKEEQLNDEMEARLVNYQNKGLVVPLEYSVETNFLSRAKQAQKQQTNQFGLNYGMEERRSASEQIGDLGLALQQRRQMGLQRDDTELNQCITENNQNFMKINEVQLPPLRYGSKSRSVAAQQSYGDRLRLATQQTQRQRRSAQKSTSKPQ